MTHPANPHLTKSKYLAGLQCARRLWLQVHARELATEPSDATQARFDEGNAVGRAAQELFPGGVLVEEAPWEHAQAVARTEELMKKPEVPAIFEAAFESEGVRIRVDVLERLSGGTWGLREVKSSTGVHEHYLDDVAVQHFVLTRLGLKVPSAELVHINRDYVRGDGAIEPAALFARADLTAESDARSPEVAARVSELRAHLDEAEPEIEPDHHCSKPVDCEFWEHCSRDKPEDWVFYLRGLRADRYQALRDQGVERIAEIPPGFGLSALQDRVRTVHSSGEPYVSRDLRGALAAGGPPAFYLDFETLAPAIPIYPSTRPYQTVPCQWSLHHLDRDGALTHREFLADGREDPREPLSESLVAALGDGSEPIVVYSSFEATQLRGLAESLPEFSEPLGRISARLLDLLPIVREHVYHPGFRSSFSLKAVAPCLAPEVSYDDLEGVSDGAAAAAAMTGIARGQITGRAEQDIRAQLLEYCGRDTLALLELHQSLRNLADS